MKHKKTNVPTGRFSFWNLYRILTRVEGGENCGSNLFAQTRHFTNTLTAYQTIDNRLSGCAAKGATLVTVSFYILYICSNQANFLLLNYQGKRSVFSFQNILTFNKKFRIIKMQHSFSCNKETFSQFFIKAAQDIVR